MIDSGLTAWMLVSASMVLLMTPGLAFFYGGMVRGKSVLNMLMMSFGSMALIAVLYVMYGWSMSYGKSLAGIIGNPADQWGLRGVMNMTDSGWNFAVADGLPTIVDVGFQVTFAMITVALISGAIADRVKFGTWMIFAGIWVTLAYFPMAHMVWGGGLLSHEGPFAAIATPIDFAGGTVVHINAGVAALVLALVIGKRRGFGTEAMRPHNLPFVMLGAALLWFGWFGFNAGSAYGASGLAGLAWVNTTTAAAAGICGWLMTEKIRDGHATSLGAASGVVAGLVAITPAAGALSPMGAIGLGAIAGVLSALAVGLKYRFGFDDALDVVGVHLVSGLWGTVAIGFLAVDGGILYGGSLNLLVVQILIALVAVTFSAVVTTLIALAIKKTVGWRVPQSVEVGGIDLSVHGESAYESLGAHRKLTTLVTPRISQTDQMEAHT